MKMKWNLLVIMTIAVVCFGVSSCGDDDDDNGGGGSGLKGWYTRLSMLPKQSDFNDINEAILKNEVLSSYHYGGQTHKYVASYDLFIDSDGRYGDTNAHFGRLRFSIPCMINAIRIVDSTTLLFYSAWLYIDGAKSEDVVYRFYAGYIFGNMAYYGTPTYYTYTRLDNKIVVSNGDIYTIVDGGLIEDGDSDLWSKYDPSQRN